MRQISSRLQAHQIWEIVRFTVRGADDIFPVFFKTPPVMRFKKKRFRLILYHRYTVLGKVNQIRGGYTQLSRKLPFQAQESTILPFLASKSGSLGSVETRPGKIDATSSEADRGMQFSGVIWEWRGPAPFYFVTVPEEYSAAIRSIQRWVTYGWGMVPVQVRIGKTQWQTSLWPKDGQYVLPLKDKVRQAEGLAEGLMVEVYLEVTAARPNRSTDR